MQKRKTAGEILAENLKKRMAQDLAIRTQKLLAARAGMDQGHLSRILKVKGSPTLELLDKLAYGCRCGAWELLVDDEQTREDYIRKALRS